MNERFISESDIVYLAHHLKSIRFQMDKETYLLEGQNEWGDQLFVSVAFRGKAIIVTVFFKEDDL